MEKKMIKKIMLMEKSKKMLKSPVPIKIIK
jgi:hypothetical protein